MTHAEQAIAHLENTSAGATELALALHQACCRAIRKRRSIQSADPCVQAIGARLAARTRTDRILDPSEYTQLSEACRTGPDQSRYHDARLCMAAGPCNPTGVSMSVHQACVEAEAEGIEPETDPAIRMMMVQLATLTRAYSPLDADRIDELRTACEHASTAKAAEQRSHKSTTAIAW